MPLLEYPRLSLEADFGDGPVTGTFELYGGEAQRDSVDDGIENAFPVDNGLNQLLGLLTTVEGDGGAGRRGLHIDVGGGQRVRRVTATLPQGGTKENGDPIQWGANDTTDTAPYPKDSATGGHPIAMQCVFQEYFDIGSPDSTNPATLEYGLYTSDSDTPYDPVDVVVKQPQVSVPSGSPRVEVSVVIAGTVDGSEAVEAAERTKRGFGF